MGEEVEGMQRADQPVDAGPPPPRCRRQQRGIGGERRHRRGATAGLVAHHPLGAQVHDGLEQRAQVRNRHAGPDAVAGNVSVLNARHRRR